MTDRPIIFSGPMVRALLDGRKTQTRRLATSPLRRAEAGDRLWVRETWACHWATDDQKPRDIDPGLWSVRYVAEDHIQPASRDGSTALLGQCWKLRPSIFMPRWASRLTLEVTGVRFEHLQAITAADAQAEGVLRACTRTGGWKDYLGAYSHALSARESYMSLWSSLHGVDSWVADPYVVALEFEVRRGNIDG